MFLWGLVVYSAGIFCSLWNPDLRLQGKLSTILVQNEDYGTLGLVTWYPWWQVEMLHPGPSSSQCRKTTSFSTSGGAMVCSTPMVHPLMQPSGNFVTVDASLNITEPLLQGAHLAGNMHGMTSTVTILSTLTSPVYD